MTDALATRVGELVDMGWSLKSQSETTAALETRSPINWWLFALSVILLFGLGVLIYLVYWLIISKARIFLYIKDGVVVASGDDWLIEQQEREREKTTKQMREIKTRGFWKVMWPAVLAWIAIVALWFLFIWWFISIVSES